MAPPAAVPSRPVVGGGARFRIGVTGHRRLPDDGRAAAAVGTALDALTAAAGERDVAVVSSLAEGADRLVAEAGLARAWALEVVLPLPAGDYEADFGDEGSRRRFRSLLAAADQVDVVAPAAAREDAYWAAGAAVVERADALLALWDGAPARGRGGTAEVVAMARAAGLPLAWVSVPSGELVREAWPWAC